MKKEAVIQTTCSAHLEKFGVQPDAEAWAPGRIEVLGNHTDYNEGTVLSAAIDLGIAFTLSRSDRPGIRLQSVDVHGEVASFSTADTDKVPGADWANYVKGVFHYLQAELKQEVDGLDCSFSGSIPMGAGLSSSAALEVAAAYALLALLGTSVDKKRIARICQKAEQVFAGTNCGLLDQFSSIFGREHGCIHSDFRSLEVTGVDLGEDIEFLVINPHVKHTLAESPYNERREQCERAASELASLLPHPVTALRDVSWEEFQANRDRIDSGAARRAAHVVGEITRVQTAVELLKKKNLAGFGDLLFQSHQSSIDFFENSCPELDVVVDAAREAGALGARLSGGGFGGSAIVMVHASDAGAIGDRIVDICRSRDLQPDVIEVTPSSGASAATLQD